MNTRTYRGHAKILVGIGILTSYERMGMASLQCETGCECDTVLMDGHTDDQFSQSGWFYHSGAVSRRAPALRLLPLCRRAQCQVLLTHDISRVLQ